MLSATFYGVSDKNKWRYKNRPWKKFYGVLDTVSKAIDFYGPYKIKNFLYNLIFDDKKTIHNLLRRWIKSLHLIAVFDIFATISKIKYVVLDTIPKTIIIS